MIYLNLLFIALIWVFIIDISGFVDECKRFISKKLTNGTIETKDWSLKPFTCSLCMTFWTGLIYLICCNHISIANIALVCLYSYATNWLKDLILSIDSLITKLLNLL